MRFLFLLKLSNLSECYCKPLNLSCTFSGGQLTLVGVIEQARRECVLRITPSLNEQKTGGKVPDVAQKIITAVLSLSEGITRIFPHNRSWVERPKVGSVKNQLGHRIEIGRSYSLNRKNEISLALRSVDGLREYRYRLLKH